MNIDSMNNVAISTDHLFVEQHPYVDNQQEGNLSQNNINSEKIVKVINKMKTSPTNLTPWYISFFSSSQSS